MEDHATCGICGAMVPLELVAEHLAEHGRGTVDELRALIMAAPVLEIVILEDPDDPVFGRADLEDPDPFMGPDFSLLPRPGENRAAWLYRVVLADPCCPPEFAPLTEDEMDRCVAALAGCGVPHASDRLHASWARHLAEHAAITYPEETP